MVTVRCAREPSSKANRAVDRSPCTLQRYVAEPLEATRSPRNFEMIQKQETFFPFQTICHFLQEVAHAHKHASNYIYRSCDSSTRWMWEGRLATWWLKCSVVFAVPWCSKKTESVGRERRGSRNSDSHGMKEKTTRSGDSNILLFARVTAPVHTPGSISGNIEINHELRPVATHTIVTKPFLHPGLSRLV